jgi:hypothetical protein
MARVHVMGGYLNVEGMSGGYPGNELPGDQPGIDNSLPPGVPPYLDNTLPEPPPGIWPPPGMGRPIVPVRPDNALPVVPGTIWPSPGLPPHAGHVLPGVPHPGGGPMPGTPARPDNTLPGGQGGQIDNALPSQTFWALVYMPSLGWRFVAVDPSLRPGMPLPPAAQPK